MQRSGPSLTLMRENYADDLWSCTQIPEDVALTVLTLYDQTVDALIPIVMKNICWRLMEEGRNGPRVEHAENH